MVALVVVVVVTIVLMMMMRDNSGELMRDLLEFAGMVINHWLS